MTPIKQDASVPIFEIDQTDEFGQYFLSSAIDILFNLNTLKKHRAILTIYVGDGQRFFLSALLGVDEASKTLYLDAANNPQLNLLADQTTQVTLSATTIERVKIQARLPRLELTSYEGKPAFAAPLPSVILRLQRREFFRVETPRTNPLRCRLTIPHPEAPPEILTLRLFDISGGGLALISKIEHAAKFVLGEIFQDGKLDIPGAGVISVNLRVSEVRQSETLTGEPQLRIGFEFVSLPGTRQSLIEHYIIRLERERKTQENS